MQLHGHLAEGWKGGEGMNVPRANMHAPDMRECIPTDAPSTHIIQYHIHVCAQCKCTKLKINGRYF